MAYTPIRVTTHLFFTSVVFELIHRSCGFYLFSLIAAWLFKFGRVLVSPDEYQERRNYEKLFCGTAKLGFYSRKLHLTQKLGV